MTDALDYISWRPSERLQIPYETTAYQSLNCRNDQLDLTCRDDFAASRNACLDVTNTLTGENFKKDTRFICKRDSKGDQCCVSWQGGVSEGEQTRLKGPAEQLIVHCRFPRDGKYMVSGLTRNTREDGGREEHVWYSVWVMGLMHVRRGKALKMEGIGVDRSN